MKTVSWYKINSRASACILSFQKCINLQQNPKRGTLSGPINIFTQYKNYLSTFWQTIIKIINSFTYTNWMESWFSVDEVHMPPIAMNILGKNEK